MLDDAGQVEGSLDTGISPANHRDPLSAEQWPVTVRAVGDSPGAVLLLTGNPQMTPTGTGGEDDGSRAQVSVGEVDGEPVPVGRETCGVLVFDEVEFVVGHVGVQRGGQFAAGGVRYRDEVVDGVGVEHLPSDALAHHGGADPLACRIDAGSGPGRAGTHDEDVVGVTLGEVLVGTGCRLGVQLLEDLGHGHPTRAPLLAVQEDRRHRLHTLGRHLVAEGRSLHRRVPDVGVEHAHGVEGLHDGGAVDAAQRHVGDELVMPLDRGDGLLEGLVLLDLVAAHLQQGEHE